MVLLVRYFVCAKAVESDSMEIVIINNLYEFSILCWTRFLIGISFLKAFLRCFAVLLTLPGAIDRLWTPGEMKKWLIADMG